MNGAPKTISPRQRYLIPPAQRLSEQPSTQHDKKKIEGRRDRESISSVKVNPHTTAQQPSETLAKQPMAQSSLPTGHSEVPLFTNGLDPDRFYMPTHMPSVAQIIKRRGGIVVDDIADSTVIIITSMQANWRKFREKIALERGDGSQPVLKDSWVIQCDQQNDQIELDPYLVSIEPSDPSTLNPPTYSNGGRRPSDIPGQTGTSKDFSKPLFTERRARNSTGSSRVESTTTATAFSAINHPTKSRDQAMEDALVELWAKHGQQWKKDEIYAALHRQYPKAPQDYFHNLRRSKRAQLDARIASIRSTGAARRETFEEHPGQSRSTKPSRIPTDEQQNQAMGIRRSRSRTPSPPTHPPEERSKGKIRFSTPENIWARAVLTRRLKQNPSTSIGEISRELYQRRDAHPFRSWQNYVSRLAAANASESNPEEASKTSPGSRSPVSEPSESDAEDTESDVPARRLRITREDEQWMLKLFRKWCGRDPSVTDAELAAELARRRPKYSLENWNRKVADNGINIAQIRQEFARTGEGVGPSSRKSKKRAASPDTEEDTQTDGDDGESDKFKARKVETSPSKKKFYTEEENRAIARFLSGYPPAERNNPFVWDTYHMKHPHRSVAAYRENYRTKRGLFDRLADEFRTWPLSSTERAETPLADEWPEDDSQDDMDGANEGDEEAEVENVVLKKEAAAKRLNYRQWELDAMAEHLSSYGPGATGKSVWQDFAARPEHTHRTLSAWAQAHLQKIDYINERAAKLRRSRIKARLSKGQSNSDQDETERGTKSKSKKRPLSPNNGTSRTNKEKRVKIEDPNEVEEDELTE